MDRSLTVLLDGKSSNIKKTYEMFWNCLQTDISLDRVRRIASLSCQTHALVFCGLRPSNHLQKTDSTAWQFCVSCFAHETRTELNGPGPQYAKAKNTTLRLRQKVDTRSDLHLWFQSLKKSHEFFQVVQPFFCLARLLNLYRHGQTAGQGTALGRKTNVVSKMFVM